MTVPVVVVFDLDDTLYLERDFAVSGFAAAAEFLYRKTRIPGLAEICLELFAGGRRRDIFDEALRLLGVLPDPVLLAGLVETYRTHSPSIALAADAARYLDAHAADTPCALVTDGDVRTQEAKVRALGLDRRMGRVVLTGALGPGRGKPHPAAFEIIEDWARPYGLPMAYVADNPAKDFVAPRARGWWTLQIDRPERVHRLSAPDAAHEAHAHIVSLDELGACLEELQDTVVTRATATGFHDARLPERSSVAGGGRNGPCRL